MIHKLRYWLFYIAILLLLSGVVMFLWNALLPEVIHVMPLNYRQALGLMVLSRILFGGFHFGDLTGRYRGGGPQSFLKSKSMSMTETDRAAFKEEWRRRCERRDEA